MHYASPELARKAYEEEMARQGYRMEGSHNGDRDREQIGLRVESCVSQLRVLNEELGLRSEMDWESLNQYRWSHPQSLDLRPVARSLGRLAQEIRVAEDGSTLDEAIRNVNDAQRFRDNFEAEFKIQDRLEQALELILKLNDRYQV